MIDSTPATRRRRALHNGGFSLIELVLAAGILGFAFVYLFGSIISINSLGNTTHKRAIAQTQLTSIMENIRLMNYAQLKAYTPPAVRGLGATATARVDLYTAAGAPTTLPVALITVFPNPVEARVTITWRNDQKRTVSLVESTMLGR